jgi:hypothetical protein
MFKLDFEENGFRKRVRPVLIPPSEYGVQCPSLSEVQPCQNPQCYVWDYDQWGSCMLDDPSEKCGTGQRNRQVYCTTHDKVDGIQLEFVILLLFTISKMF